MAFTVVIVAIIAVLNEVSGVPVKGNEIKAKRDTSAVVKLSRRSILTSPQNLWVKTRHYQGKPIVEIPYVINNLQPQLLPYLTRYMDEFAAKSCIQWVDNGASDKVHVIFTSDVVGGVDPMDSCLSHIGRPSQPYTIHINTDCVGLSNPHGRLSNMPHEMMHALGFIHEHQRMDRDCYVNIQEEFRHAQNFKYFTDSHADLTFPYNPKSIMQYPSNEKMQSKFGEFLGPRTDSPHEMDWMQINYVYCDGPHICDTDKPLCEYHKNLKLQGGCPLQ